MKKLFKLFGIIALAAVIGLTMTSCGGDGGETEKSIVINNINQSGSGGVGVFLAAELPQDGNMPTLTAIQYGSPSNNTLSLALVLPVNNTFNSGPPWTGSGNYYVYLVPVSGNSFSWSIAFVYTGGGNAPVRVGFNRAVTTLSFGDFRPAFQ